MVLHRFMVVFYGGLVVVLLWVLWLLCGGFMVVVWWHCGGFVVDLWWF